MNDRELLEAAARAVGIKLVWSSTPGLSPRLVDKFDTWNPLIEDEDAFRLAIKLDISLRQQYAMVIAEYPFRDEAFNTRSAICEKVFDDACTSSRRAIVRAAAEIGKRMIAQSESIG
jgi:hypothetical protein